METNIENTPNSNRYIAIARIDRYDNQTVEFSDEDIRKINSDMSPIEYLFHKINEDEEPCDIEDASVYIDEFIIVSPNGDYKTLGGMDIGLVSNQIDKILGDRKLNVVDADGINDPYIIDMIKNPVPLLEQDQSESELGM